MSTDDETPAGRRRPGLSRRSLLLGAAAAGGLVVGGAGGAATAAAIARADEAADAIDLSTAHPFYGSGLQAGITTPVQRYAVVMTFDFTGSSARDLQVLLAQWSAAIAQLMKGATVGQVEPSRVDGIAGDTGEALDLMPAALTVTVGMGPGLFGHELGLSGRAPARLRELNLPTGALRPEISGGDLSVQACADDPQVAYHAVRSLARIGKKSGTAATRWTVMGFGRASAGPGQATPRNLMGFKDGTRNATSPDDARRFVIASDGPGWTRGGSYQVIRKIQMHIENWDTDRVSDQNNVFGRHKVSGAPLTGTDEFDTPDFAKKDRDGSPVIPATAHIRLAAHENNDGVKILRRSFNYTDGINQYGFLDAGLLFISYQNDLAHFERLQSKLDAYDALNEYITHIGSGVFFVPPAPRAGSYLAEPLFS